jgi:VWFA-related protein
VNVVNVFATVREKDGKIVRDLGKDDFNILEDGRPQVIRYFSQQSDLPLVLGLLVDTSGSERRMISTERAATRTFLEQVLRPEKDKAFLIHFDHDVELLEDVTSSRERLEKALGLLDSSASRPPQDSNPDDNSQGGGGRGRGRGGHGHFGHMGTAFYDAIYLASGELMSKQTGRKALIMLTDGEDSGSKISLAEAITSSERAETLAYSIRIADSEGFPQRGFGGPGGGGHHGGGRGGPGAGRDGGMNRPDGKKILEQISRETGGSYFEMSKKKTIDQIYKQIDEELRSQYSIGYSSDLPGDTGFRKIQLTVKRKGLTVQSRDGYYPTSKPHAS